MNDKNGKFLTISFPDETCWQVSIDHVARNMEITIMIDDSIYWLITRYWFGFGLAGLSLVSGIVGFVLGGMEWAVVGIAGAISFLIVAIAAMIVRRPRQ